MLTPLLFVLEVLFDWPPSEPLLPLVRNYGMVPESTCNNSCLMTIQTFRYTGPSQRSFPPLGWENQSRAFPVCHFYIQITTQVDRTMLLDALNAVL